MAKRQILCKIVAEKKQQEKTMTVITKTGKRMVARVIPGRHGEPESSAPVHAPTPYRQVIPMC
jgi:hypothetical protein